MISFAFMLEISRKYIYHQVHSYRFVLESVDNACKDLTKKRTESKQKIKTIEEQIAYWKIGVKESEENIRDMVSQRREK